MKIRKNTLNNLLRIKKNTEKSKNNIQTIIKNHIKGLRKLPMAGMMHFVGGPSGLIGPKIKLYSFSEEFLKFKGA